MKLIASITTYPARINAVHLTIESILNQTKKPDLVVLWLAKDEFNNTQLPSNLTSLTKLGLEIKWIDKNLKSFNKLIPALKEYPDDIIATFDDDMIYDKHCLELLYNGYLKYPQCVQCHKASRILCKDKEILPYNDWVWEIKSKNTKPSYTNFAVASSGVLYPPHCLYKDVLRDDIFLKLCPREDDVWFWSMEVLNQTKINVVKNNIIKQVLNKEATQEFALINTNVNLGESTEQLRKVLEYYPIIYKMVLNNFVYKGVIRILFMPLLKIKKTPNKLKIYLFNFIPIYEKKEFNKYTKFKICGMELFTICKI